MVATKRGRRGVRNILEQEQEASDRALRITKAFEDDNVRPFVAALALCLALAANIASTTRGNRDKARDGAGKMGLLLMAYTLEMCNSAKEIMEKEITPTKII